MKETRRIKQTIGFVVSWSVLKQNIQSNCWDASCHCILLKWTEKTDWCEQDRTLRLSQAVNIFCIIHDRTIKLDFSICCYESQFSYSYETTSGWVIRWKRELFRVLEWFCICLIFIEHTSVSIPYIANLILFHTFNVLDFISNTILVVKSEDMSQDELFYLLNSISCEPWYVRHYALCFLEKPPPNLWNGFF